MRPLPIPTGTVACWHVNLECPDEQVTTLAQVLSPDEHERAAAFVFAGDRRRYIVTRACLRVLLARCCDATAASIRFVYGPNGKPRVMSGTNLPPVHFSVSHTGDLSLIGLARDVPLGVDVETMRSMPDLRHLASRYFTGAEAETIATVPTEERELAFFLCWTRKEAFSKALGDGLSFALDRCRVTCRPGEPARILEVDGSVAAAREWTVFDVRPAPGVVGAAVVKAPPGPLSLAALDVANDVVPCLSG